MSMNIDKIKIKVSSFTAELEKSIDSNLRCFVTTEVECGETAMVDNGDGTFDQVFRTKVVGNTVLNQQGQIVKGKSKRGSSQRLRGAIFYHGIGMKVDDEEKHYEEIMDKLIANFPAVYEFLKQV